ncbi:MAG: hypothetical protein WBA73_12115 [Devosia sp.]
MTITKADYDLDAGEVVEIETPAGLRHVQVLAVRAPYPEILRAIRPGAATDAASLAARPTAFAAMTDLGRALSRGEVKGRLLGRAPAPEDGPELTTFRIPVRNPRGGIAYWWLWDEDGLRLDPDDGPSDRASREITSIARLIDRLAAL